MRQSRRPWYRRNIKVRPRLGAVEKAHWGQGKTVAVGLGRGWGGCKEEAGAQSADTAEKAPVEKGEVAFRQGWGSGEGEVASNPGILESH